MTVKDIRQKFELRMIEVWRRLGSTVDVVEARPHLVPLDSAAEGFVAWQRNLSQTSPHVVFGKLYTGFGTALIGDRWTQTFRFVNMSQDEAVNAFIVMARAYEHYLESLNSEATEKIETPKQE